jgi:hypothetical protein
MRLAGIIIALAIACSPALAAFHGVVSSGDPTSAVLPTANDVYLNWKNAGLQMVGGIPTRATVCSTVNPIGGSSDDFTHIQAAINACPANEVVQLGAGTFNVYLADLPIQLSASVVLRGTGTCNNGSSPYCQSVISVYDGLLQYTANPNCGHTAPGSACPNGGPDVISMSPVAPDYDYSWAQCGNTGSSSPGSTGNSCGAHLLTADAAQGDTTVHVASTTGFSVGQWVLIDEESEGSFQTDPIGAGQVWASSDAFSSSPSPATGRVIWMKHNPNLSGSGIDDFTSGETPTTLQSAGCYFAYCGRAASELHKIASIGSGTITFDDPLTIAFRQSGSHAAQVYGGPYANQSGTGSPMAFLQNAGVENLTVIKAANGGIEMEFCADCWIKGVEVTGWYNGGINVIYSARSEITDTLIGPCWDSVNSGGEYPIAFQNGDTEILLDNNIIRLGGKGMIARSGAANVIAYNYQDDTMYDLNSGIGDSWVDLGTNASHSYNFPHHYLLEGNWGDNCDDDFTHGNAMYHTFFRNWCSGIRTTFVDPSNGKTVNDATGSGWGPGASPSPQTTGPERAGGTQPYNYWLAFVGNVMGTSGVTVSGNGFAYAHSDWNLGNAIWYMGWNNWDNSEYDTNLSGATPFMFRHGDYDYYNSSIVDWTTGYSHTLPNSFYLAAAPYSAGANCTYPWPWVTPTAGSVIQAPTGAGCSSTDGLPAKARWDAGTPFVQP